MTRRAAFPTCRSIAGWSPILLCLALVAAGCGDDSGDAPAPGRADARGSNPGGEGRLPQKPDRPGTDATLRRERAAVFFAKEQFDEALSELQPLFEVQRPDARDFVTAAQIALRLGDWETAATRLDRALELDSLQTGALYTRARLHALEYELEEARSGFARVLELVPTDPASKLGLANALRELEESDEDLTRAKALLEEVAGLGLPNGLQWYVTAVYQRWRISLEDDEPEEVVRIWQSAWDALFERGFQAVRADDLDQGDLARVGPPMPFGTFPAAAPEAPTFGEPRVIASLPADTEAVWCHDLDGDRTPDLVTLAGGSVAAHLRDRKTGALTSFTLVASGASAPVRTLDLNQRRSGDTLDVLVTTGETLVLIEQSDALEGERWAPSPVALPEFGGAIRDVETVDFDHEGDLDLFVVGDFGARLLRNDGAGARVDEEGKPLERGEWVDASEPASLPTGPQTWCIVEDFDGDNDVDLLCAGEGGVHLMDSLRRGLFVDRGESAFGEARFPREPLVADFDGNGRPDLFFPGAEGSALYLQTYEDWTFHRISLDAKVPAASAPCAADIDFDGTIDLCWATPNGGADGILAVGLTTAVPFTVPAIEGAGPWMAVGDLDTPDPYADLALEISRIAGDSLVSVSPAGELGNAIYLKFIGQKDNRQGVGAIVEVRARDTYRRTFWRGDAETIGIGEQKFVDVVRVTWPNGVVQQELDVEAGVAILLDNPAFGVQPEGLIGSCPFLYTWNGETFEFISDVLGITPLGLPMAPGMLVPPDHDEYVLVRGDQLRPDSNGELVLQFTEELREVTYLDRVRLDVIDHPKGSAIYPNERFTFPPFPEPHTHVVERVARVQRATGSDGSDWTEEIREIDMRHAAPLQRLGGQYLGLAEPHWLELEFDPEDLEGASMLRLVATGWFFWSDASVNMASAGTPTVDFVPPTLQIPGPDGTWVPAGPPIGFPAGKSKTMVVDVSAILPKDDPRMRIGSTLELYWDCIEIATCNDDGEVWTKSLEPVGTELWSRGFSRPIVPEREDVPLFFDWNQVDQSPRWNQHPGQYTRYGEVLPLVTEIDDQYVIMGSGDALTIRFDASDLPALPDGFERDYLVFLDGWAKDRDPNTHEALRVDPLPFHGMSGYPYGADETFPATEAHEAWRRDWNTRPAHDWIVPMSVKAEARWLEHALERSRRSH